MTRAGCPCGSGAAYRECCGPFVRRETEAPTAEALMRSRYTAYVRRDEPYLLRTWHASTRPASLGLQLDDTVWLGLEVTDRDAGGLDDQAGIVTFAASYEDADGSVATMRETSRFVCEGGVWLYVEGDAPD